MTERRPVTFPKTEFEAMEIDMVKIPLSVPESLSAMASLIADGWFLPMTKGVLRFQSTVVLRKITQSWRKLFTACSENFLEVYLRRVIVPAEDGKRSMHRVSQEALRTFGRKIVGNGILNTENSWFNAYRVLLIPAIADSWEFKVKPIPESTVSGPQSALPAPSVTPRTSLSSDTNSFRMMALEQEQSSSFSFFRRRRRALGQPQNVFRSYVTRFLKRKSSSSMSIESHSSWSFSVVTGLPRASIHEDIEDPDHNMSISREVTEDVEMKDACS